MFKQTTVCLLMCLFEELCYLGVCIGREYCTETFDGKCLHLLMSLGLAYLFTVDCVFRGLNDGMHIMHNNVSQDVDDEQRVSCLSFIKLSPAWVIYIQGLFGDAYLAFLEGVSGVGVRSAAGKSAERRTVCFPGFDNN